MDSVFEDAESIIDDYTNTATQPPLNSIIPSPKVSTIIIDEPENTKDNLKQYLAEHIKEFSPNFNYLKDNFRQLFPKFKNSKDKNKHFKQIFETQNFKADSSPIWIAKFSYNGEFFATGSKNGTLTIFEIFKEEQSFGNFKKNGIIHYLDLINETPYQTYKCHKSDIIDLDWSSKNPNLIVTVSIDHTAILYDITIKTPLHIYQHNGIVSCVCFSTIESINEEAFITGCFDKIIRVWGTSNSAAPLTYVNVTEFITAIAFFPTGEYVAVGNNNGKCSVYSYGKKLVYSFSFNCRNKNGKYSDGRKITNIFFINCNDAIITTNDSRIRMINVSNGDIIHKYKGLVNDDTIIRSSYDELSDSVISASDDGNVLIWRNNRMNFNNSTLKNYSYESIKPFQDGEKPLCAMFVCEKAFETFIDRVKLAFGDIVGISALIICGNNGTLQILFNCEKILE